MNKRKKGKKKIINAIKKGFSSEGILSVHSDQAKQSKSSK